MKKVFATALFIVLVLLIWYIFGNHYKNHIMNALGILAVLSVIAIAFGANYSKLDKGSGRILIVFGIINFIVIFLVLSSFDGHRKGYTAYLKAILANSRAQAALLYKENSPHSFVGICANESMKKILNTEYVQNLKCFDDQDSFVITAQSNAVKNKRVISSEMKDIYVCVDSSGSFKEINETQYFNITSTKTVCQ